VVLGTGPTRDYGQILVEWCGWAGDMSGHSSSWQISAGRVWPPVPRSYAWSIIGPRSWPWILNIYGQIRSSISRESEPRHVTSEHKQEPLVVDRNVNAPKYVLIHSAHWHLGAVDREFFTNCPSNLEWPLDITQSRCWDVLRVVRHASVRRRRTWWRRDYRRCTCEAWNTRLP